jgi:hypothetical protein
MSEYKSSREISGFHGDEDLSPGLLVCDAVSMHGVTTQKTRTGLNYRAHKIPPLKRKLFLC